MPNNAPTKKEFHVDLSTANPKQMAFFRARKRFIAYGGARGGGKSWAARQKAVMMALRYGGIRILILRRTFPELEENHIVILQGMLNGVAIYNESKKRFLFPNGSTIKLGYCMREKDVNQYQGQEYDIIIIDEATHFTEYQYGVLTACLRGANDFPKRFYLTCNPGGVGHQWVKRLFVSKSYKDDENPGDYEFIPATVFDNKILLEKDPGYVRLLNNLPEAVRAAWRDGNWDMLAGQYFDEFDRAVHVIEPIPIPDHWLKYRAIDYGLDCLACLWIAIDTLGNYYVYREYAESDKVISKGAEEIVELSSGDGYIRYTVAPSDLWARSQESAKSKADLFREGGLTLIKGNNNREAGWLAVKEQLRVVDDGEGKKTSRLRIFSTCTELIECIPALQRDLKKPTDCATKPHEFTHLPDALRYFVLQYTVPSKEQDTRTPADIFKDKKAKEAAKRFKNRRI